jgi:sorting nexin-25
MVLGIFFKNKRITTFLLAVIACLIQLTVGWTQQRILWTLAAPFISLCFLLALNTLVLYIYIKYFLSPNTLNKQQDNNFKPLRFTHKSVWPRLEKQRQAENTANKPGFDDPEISLAFNKLLQYVVRDFIESWFVKITGTIKEQTFPFAVDHIIRSAAHKVTERLESTDLLYLVLNRIIPKMTLHISDFRAAEMSLLGRSLERSVTQSDELDLLLASQFRTGKLHVALTTAAVTTKPTETAYLRNILERVLPLIIDEKELSSGPVRVIIREVVSNSILQPVMDMLADPDFWNQTIDTYVSLYKRY